MHRILILGAMALVAGSIAVTGYGDIESRLERLDRLQRETPSEVRAIEASLAGIHGELEELHSLLGVLDARDSRGADELRDRLSTLTSEIGATAARLVEQQTGLETLESRQREVAREELRVRLETIEVSLAQWNRIQDDVTAIATLVRTTKDEVDSIGAEMSRDVDVMWCEIVGPTVQLAGEATVGSGVLLQSREKPGTGEYETLILTSWHVVRDIRADAGGADPSIPVAVYTSDGAVLSETAQLVHYDAHIDAAVLRLNTTLPVACGARLASRERLDRMRIFEPVYAVGCPLGNDPIPTAGEISATDHVIDGNSYWMISAPTYIGNSGGGLYDAQTHELLGIFSKIYTHGSLRPTVVPHMGLVTPLTQIYDWLEAKGYARVDVTFDKESPILTLVEH
ncbi:MAG: hypothetical protein E2O39_13265 [Planctomycetota bacterium]|nr:MAG: hypothetical protein E2O39_13265 [Planctomycetota bacterium]